LSRQLQASGSDEQGIGIAVEAKTMNEDEWLACTDPRLMLGFRAFLHGEASNRKMRLFACACCRRIWNFLPDQRSQDAVAVAERFADGAANPEELKEAWADAQEAQWEAMDRVPVPEPGEMFQEDPFVPERAAVDAVNPDFVVVHGEWHTLNAMLETAEAQGMQNELEALAELLREIFGNPFRPLPPHPDAIAPLAEDIYAGRWELMPLLGEWLQENGFWSEGEHCLDPSVKHVKGCWVIDWVTGRE
jgi:hypothetical protein